MTTRRRLALLLAFVVVAVAVNLGANAIHPTLRMVSIPITLAVAIVAFVIALRRGV
jgi:hypothetical protein